MSHHDETLRNSIAMRQQMPDTADRAVAYQVEQEIRSKHFLACKLMQDECIDPLHIVMEDGNVEDMWLPLLLSKYAREWAALPATRKLAEHLVGLSEADRRIVHKNYWCWFWHDHPAEAPAWFSAAVSRFNKTRILK